MNRHVSNPNLSDTLYEHAETHELVALVCDAAELIRNSGEAAFNELSANGSRWRQGESYIFVLEPEGNMRVHLHPENVMSLAAVCATTGWSVHLSCTR